MLGCLGDATDSRIFRRQYPTPSSRGLPGLVPEGAQVKPGALPAINRTNGQPNGGDFPMSSVPWYMMNQEARELPAHGRVDAAKDEDWLRDGWRRGDQTRTASVSSATRKNGREGGKHRGGGSEEKILYAPSAAKKGEQRSDPCSRFYVCIGWWTRRRRAEDEE